MANTGGANLRKNFKGAYGFIKEASEEVTDETAQRLAATIKPRLWDRKMPVKVRKSGPLNREVVVGSRRYFWAGFSEFGTIHQPAKPVVVPAAEAERRRFVEAMQDALRAAARRVGG